MKKLFALLLLSIYVLSSNTLVHSFCAKAHLQEALQHDCCDESDEDCYDNCMSLYKDSVTSAVELKDNTKALHTGIFGNGLYEEIIQDASNNSYFSELVFDPPWQDTYIWIIKKLE